MTNRKHLVSGQKLVDSHQSYIVHFCGVQNPAQLPSGQGLVLLFLYNCTQHCRSGEHLRNLHDVAFKRLAQIPSSLLCKNKLWLTTLFCVLASKTKKQIFVSYNLQNTDSNFTLLIENRIKEEMKAFPDKF